MTFVKRKPNRLPWFDYSTPGAYFITICTRNRKNIFWETVGASIARPQDILLSKYGRAVEKAVLTIPKKYPSVSVDHYAIMPNHLHLLLLIHADADGRPMVAPTVSLVVQQMKGAVTKQAGFPLWQKGFHDHVIRNEKDYQMIWQYIDSNPACWEKDCFYETE